MDTRRSPLFVIDFPATYEYEELNAAFDHVEATIAALAQSQPDHAFSLLVDATLVTRSEARNRRRIAASHEKVEAALEGRLAVGQAFAMPSALTRGALQAVFWLKPLPWPTKVVATRAQAEAWLVERYAEHGITIPDTPTALGTDG